MVVFPSFSPHQGISMLWAGAGHRILRHPFTRAEEAADKSYSSSGALTQIIFAKRLQARHVRPHAHLLTIRQQHQIIAPFTYLDGRLEA